MRYLISEAKRIISDIGYPYNDIDVKVIARKFDECYTEDFEPYSIWYNVITEYFGEN